MKTMPASAKALIGFGIIVGLLSAGYWIATQKVEPIAEIPGCHPLFGDLAPNGNMFVALTPDKLAVTVSPFNSDKKPFVINLARPASDIIAISNQAVLLSYGTAGEISLLNVEGGQPEQIYKVGNNVGVMCKNTSSQAFIADTENGKVYQFDLSSKSVIKTYSLKGKPTTMRWREPDVELEVFGEKEESLGILNVTTKTNI